MNGRTKRIATTIVVCFIFLAALGLGNHFADARLVRLEKQVVTDEIRRFEEGRNIWRTAIADDIVSLCSCILNSDENKQCLYWLNGDKISQAIDIAGSLRESYRVQDADRMDLNRAERAIVKTFAKLIEVEDFQKMELVHRAIPTSSTRILLTLEYFKEGKLLSNKQGFLTAAKLAKIGGVVDSSFEEFTHEMKKKLRRELLAKLHGTTFFSKGEMKKIFADLGVSEEQESGFFRLESI